MGEETSGATHKDCRQCGASIPGAARLCSTCGSYQDWRGGLAISSTVLALLVALVSVGTAAVPVISAALEHKESRVEISNVELRETELRAVAVNSGQLPATISEVVMHGGGTLLIGYPATRDDTYLPSGAKQVVFEFRPKMSAATARQLVELPEGELQPNGSHQQTLGPIGVIEIFVTNSDGVVANFATPINIIKLAYPLISHANRCEVDEDYSQSGVCSDRDQ